MVCLNDNSNSNLSVSVIVMCAVCGLHSANDSFQEIVPAFEQHQVSLPAGCAFGVDRDTYAVQEQHKYSENAGKWTCGFCGKSFYEERFLDKHFDARHSDRTVTV